MSHPANWLCTRRFNEPTFRPSGATKHWKNTMLHDFSTFSCALIVFLLTLSLLWCSFFFSSLLFDFLTSFNKYIRIVIYTPKISGFCPQQVWSPSPWGFHIYHLFTYQWNYPKSEKSQISDVSWRVDSVDLAWWIAIFFGLAGLGESTKNLRNQTKRKVKNSEKIFQGKNTGK